MSKTVVKQDESIEETLKRFKRDVAKSGTLAQARRKEHYVKPSVEKKLRNRNRKS